MIATLLAAAAVLPAAAESADHAEAGGLPQMDVSTYASQIFWLLIAFGLLYLLLSRVFLPRLGAVLEERRDRIADDLDTAATLRSEADDAGRAMDAAMADARARAHAIMARQREQLTAEIDAEAGQAEAALDARLGEAEATIARRKGEALARVRDVATDTAGVLVQKLIGVQLSEAETEAAVDAAGRA